MHAAKTVNAASNDARLLKNRALKAFFWKGTAYFATKVRMAGAPISAACEAHASFPHKCSRAANVEPESFPVSFCRSNLHIRRRGRALLVPGGRPAVVNRHGEAPVTLMR